MMHLRIDMTSRFLRVIVLCMPLLMSCPADLAAGQERTQDPKQDPSKN
jgi:hypothetical protein